MCWIRGAVADFMSVGFVVQTEVFMNKNVRLIDYLKTSRMFMVTFSLEELKSLLDESLPTDSLQDESFWQVGTPLGDAVVSAGYKPVFSPESLEKQQMTFEVQNRKEYVERFFERSELVPAIIFSPETKTVLMMAYMNRESLLKTLDTRQTWFYSRSRGLLWNKGETSGNFQNVLGVYADCDCDTLLVNVTQIGNACHTGLYSCFYNQIV